MSGAMMAAAAAAAAMYKFKLTGGAVDAASADPSDANATLRIDSDGSVYQTVNGSTTQLNSSTDWIRPAQFAPGGSTPLAGGTFNSVRATLQSGDTPSGTLDSWLDLGTDRSWALAQSEPGAKACSLLVEIRGEPGGAVFASATYTLSATVV
jgi:hypothetical protein